MVADVSSATKLGEYSRVWLQEMQEFSETSSYWPRLEKSFWAAATLLCPISKPFCFLLNQGVGHWLHLQQPRADVEVRLAALSWESKERHSVFRNFTSCVLSSLLLLLWAWSSCHCFFLFDASLNQGHCQVLATTVSSGPGAWCLEEFERNREVFPPSAGLASLGAGLGPGTGTISLACGAAQQPQPFYFLEKEKVCCRLK